MDQKEKYQLLNRLNDYIFLAQNKYVTSTTRFLNPFEQSLLISTLKATPDINYYIYGGYEGSERNIIIISPKDSYVNTEDYLALTMLTFSKYDSKYLAHRTILGSVLSLGITRDGIGDIIIDINNLTAYIISTKKMAVYIDSNLLNVGRAHVNTALVDDIHSTNLNIKEPKPITGTVASLRIDSVLALGLRLSRTKASELIKEQLIYINWQLVTKPTIFVKENDTITIRKKGRIVVKAIGNSSKKNRQWIELSVYG